MGNPGYISAPDEAIHVYTIPKDRVSEWVLLQLGIHVQSTLVLYVQYTKSPPVKRQTDRPDSWPFITWHATEAREAMGLRAYRSTRGCERDSFSFLEENIALMNAYIVSNEE